MTSGLGQVTAIAHWPPEQIPLWQSDPVLHPPPSTQAGHDGPPQSTPVSLPFLTPSVQVEEDTHAPFVQVAPEAQATPHAPQFAASASTDVSQPFDRSWSQSERPAAQKRRHSHPPLAVAARS